MSELTINQLIKIILGFVVVVVVIAGVGFFFKNYVWDFFNNFFPKAEIFLSFIK